MFTRWRLKGSVWYVEAGCSHELGSYCTLAEVSWSGGQRWALCFQERQSPFQGAARRTASTQSGKKWLLNSPPRAAWEVEQQQEFSGKRGKLNPGSFCIATEMKATLAPTVSSPVVRGPSGITKARCFFQTECSVFICPALQCCPSPN